jgi:magnesium transporter
VRVLDAIDPDAIGALRGADEYFWLDLVAPPAEDLRRLAELFALHEIVLEDLEHFGQRPKLDDYERFVQVVFYGVEGDELVEVHVIVHGDAMVTVRRRPCAALEAVRPRIEQLDAEREEHAIYRVLDALTDSYFPLLERMEDEIEQVEQRIVEDGGRAPDLHAFAARRRRLSALRRVVGPQRDMLAGAGDFMDRVPGLRADQAHDYYRDVYDHLLRIGDGIDGLRDVLTSIHDIYLSAQSNRLNEVVYRLTVVGTIFLPITFITGFFGQNFGWLVDHIRSEAAFWVLGIGLEVVSVWGLLVWFRRAGVRR